MYDILIKNGKVVDGEGNDAFYSDIAVKDGKIERIDKDIKSEAKCVINAEGKFVTPGFIDMHSHGDLTAPFYPDMESPLGQGITTIFAGHCGLGVAPVDKYWMEVCPEEEAITAIYPRNVKGHGPGFERIVKTDDLVKPVKDILNTDLDWRTFGELEEHLRKSSLGVNLVSCVGHSCIRVQVMGEDYKREATKDEVEKMKELLRRTFREGAWGLSFGLDYNPGIYASFYELTELAKVCKEYDRMLTAHVRMGCDRLDPSLPHEIIDGIREFLEIGLESKARIHISHIASGFTVSPYDEKLSILSAKRTLEIIDEYRAKGVNVTWDVLAKNTLPVFNSIELIGKVYPYVMNAGGKHKFIKLLSNKEYLNNLKEEIRSGNCISVSSNYGINPVRNPDWDTWFFISRSKVEGIEGKSLKEAAEFLHMDSIDAYFYIIINDMDTRCAYYYDGNTEAQDYFCAHKDACIGLDNVAFNYGYEMGLNDMPLKSTQPAGYCGMIKYICSDLEGRFEETIKHITGNPAKTLGLNDRGLLKEGMQADIVVLDREKLSPNENPAVPSTHPKGIDYVIVNGKISLKGNEFTHVRSGFVISKEN